MMKRWRDWDLGMWNKSTVKRVFLHWRWFFHRLWSLEWFLASEVFYFCLTHFLFLPVFNNCLMPFQTTSSYVSNQANAYVNNQSGYNPPSGNSYQNAYSSNTSYQSTANSASFPSMSQSNTYPSNNQSYQQNSSHSVYGANTGKKFSIMLN